MAHNRKEKLERYFLSVINNERRGKGALTVRWLLRQLSRIYGAAVFLRLYLYRIGIFRHHTLGCQVISIGNLTVGGTGKTPVVEVFARDLQKEGRKVAVLSRGYKRVERPFLSRLVDKLTFRSGTMPPLVVSDGNSLLLDSAVSGDEPYMLASNLPGVCVLVDKNRVKSGQYAINKLKCDTLILDDGFQYLALKHRVEIVLVDSTNPFSNNYVLPRGLLREPVKNIARSNFIFMTKSSGRDGNELEKKLRSLNPSAEISECTHNPRHVKNTHTGEIKPLDFLCGKRIAAVSGIASPKGFENELRRLGAHVVYIKRFTDHHRYTKGEISELMEKAAGKGVDFIVTTEKDAVRFPRIDENGLPVYFLRVEIELLSGAEDFRACISRICFRQDE